MGIKLLRANSRLWLKLLFLMTVPWIFISLLLLGSENYKVFGFYSVLGMVFLFLILSIAIEVQPSSVELLKTARDLREEENTSRILSSQTKEISIPFKQWRWWQHALFFASIPIPLFFACFFFNVFSFAPIDDMAWYERIAFSVPLFGLPLFCYLAFSKKKVIDDDEWADIIHDLTDTTQ